MSWIQFSVEVTRDRTEVVSEAFVAAGALAVSLQDASGDPLLEPAPGEQPLWSKTRVLALYSSDCRPERVAIRLRALLLATEILRRVEPLEDRDWSAAWRDNFHAMCFGTRLWVCPTGESASDAAAVTVQMNPGMAFGTGTHATTALCLQWLDGNPPAGLSVIDYGCGSGILAIAACKLGATRVHAVDIDPQALQAARTNATRNDVADSLVISFPEEPAVQPADLVIANILANPLVELAARIGSLVRLHGRLLLTGILRDQAEYVMSAYAARFDFSAPVQRGEWVLLEGVSKNAAVIAGKVAE
jgi:ribosomal protein L11 methyltransferase